MKKHSKIIAGLLCIVFMFTLVSGCNTETESGTTINLLTRGWINLPTQGDDPYKKWILDNYGLNVNLNATNDIGNAAQIAFNSLTKPDVVAFPDYPSFTKLEAQKVFVEDWTPFLDKMPNMKAFIESDDQKFLKSLFTDGEGRLRAIWTTPNATTWSLKIREDWANEYRATTVSGVAPDGTPNYYPAGNTATDGGPWQPKSDIDLLNFARFIRVEKNKGANLQSPDYFGFTTSGSGRDFGTLGDWLPMMWGFVSTPPYGIYSDKTTNKANFIVEDGTFEPMLNYMKKMVDEQLIVPNWFNQLPTNDERTKAGKIGMVWYTSVISEMTANYNPDVDTTGWWKTYCIPNANPDSPIGGTMLTDSVASSIITVSAKTSINSEKMDKICAFLDDIICYYDKDKDGKDKYVRGAAYDALKWGVGVDGDLEYQDIEDTDYQYICVRTGNTYRETSAGNGAWDWGAWFSTTNDGIIQGESDTVSPIVLKAVDHDLQTASYSKVLQEGSFLKLNQTDLNNMASELTKFKYAYVTGTNTTSIAQFQQKWRTTLKGTAMLEQATEQFKALGFISG